MLSHYCLFNFSNWKNFQTLKTIIIVLNLNFQIASDKQSKTAIVEGDDGEVTLDSVSLEGKVPLIRRTVQYEYLTQIFAFPGTK